MNIVVVLVFFNGNERVVLNYEIPPITPVTQVDFLWLPTANLFVAFVINFLADQNAMSCVGGGLTLHLTDKTVRRFCGRNWSLNGIINI